MPPLGPRKATAAPNRRPRPAPSTAFGPLGNTLAQTSAPARKAAAVKERQAANQLPSRPQLPIIPKLPSYTLKQQQEIGRRVGPAVLKAVVHEGHAQGYASDAAHHERNGGSHQQASTPFARLLRNSNAQERDTLHIFERLGGAHAVNGAVEGARRQTVKTQIGAVLAGKAPGSLASDLEKRGYLTRHHVFGAGSLPKVGGYYTTEKAGTVGAPVGATRFEVSKIGTGTSFLNTPAAVAQISHAVGNRGGGVGRILGNAGADLALGPTMAAGTLVRAAQHPRQVAGETAKAIGQTFAHPVASFKEHPVWTLQTFEGARAAAGRGAGALARGATKGRVGDTTRSPLSLVGDQGTRLVYNRSYSKDIMRQAAQRATDKMLKPVLDEHGKPATVMQHGREVPLMRASTARPVTRPSRLLKKRGDFESSRATSLQQSAVAYEEAQARQMLPTREHRGGKVGQRVGAAIDRSLPAQPVNALQARFLPKRALRPEHDLVSMAVEGTIRPGSMHADLVKERGRLESEYKGLKSPQLRSANRFRARTIDRALADPIALRNEAGVFGAAHKFSARINELQDQGVQLHQIPAGAAARAKLFPYAMSHMGARYSDELHGAAQQAVKDETAAVRTHATAVRQLRLKEERQRGGADVQTAAFNRRIRAQDPQLVQASRARSTASKELTAANRDLRAAQRSAVDPQRLSAARDRVSAAQAAVKGARQAHAQAVTSFEQRVEGAHAKAQRGGKLTRAEARLAKHDRRPTGRLAKLEDTRANRIRAEKELHAAKGRHVQARQRLAQTPAAELVDANGRKLSNEQIHAHMSANGVEPRNIGYVPHQLNLKSATAYYQQALRSRPSVSDAKRTGAAYKAGATSPTIHNLAESVIRQAGSLANLRSFDRLVHDAGIRHKDGSYFTMAEAEHEMQRRSVDSHNFNVPGEPALVPVRTFKAKLSADERARVRDMQDPRAGAGVENVLEPWQRRLDRSDRTSRNVALMPEPLVKRIDEHLQRSGPGAKIGQGVTSAFRQTVLPFSSKWLVGNVAEAVLRLGAVGATILPGDRNIAAGRAVIRELLKGDAQGLEGAVGKQAARDVIDHLLGGQLYGNRSLRVRRSGQEMFGDIGHAVSQTPVIHEIAGSYRTVTGGIFRLNKALEQRSQVAALGKFARKDIQQFTGSWAKGVRLQRDAVQEAARGLTDTAKQHEAARFIDETLGQYSRFSPTIRHFIQNAAPFLPWYLNSVRFVFWTLPAHHPIKSALLANAEKAFQQDWTDQHKGLPPGSLRTAVPTRSGGWLDLARFTPFGGPGPVLAGDNAALVAPLYPQFQGTVNALQGKDPFGQALKVPTSASNPKGTASPGQQRKIAANTFLEGVVPGLAVGRRLREHGETAFATSTVLSPRTKPGTSHGMSALRRIFDPTRPTFLKAGAKGALAGLPPAEQRALQREADSVASQAQAPNAAEQAALQREADLIAGQAKP